MEDVSASRNEAVQRFDPAVVEALGEFLGRPSARISAEVGDALLRLVPERPNEDELPHLADAVDRYVFDCALARLRSVSDTEWLAALAPERKMRNAAAIALASPTVLEAYALCTAAAAFQVPISRHVTKAAADRIRRIMPPEAAELAFGEAQFFYPELATVCDAESAHAEFSQRDDRAAREGMAAFGAAVAQDLIDGISPVWAGLLRFRRPVPPGDPPTFALREVHRELLFRLWERKWPSWRNS
jgi:hypothetical protein